MILRQATRIKISPKSFRCFWQHTLIPNTAIIAAGSRTEKNEGWLGSDGLNLGRYWCHTIRRNTTTIATEAFGKKHLYMLPTSSEFVFIAADAVENYQIDLDEAYCEQKLPPLFRAGDFEYVSPKWYKSANKRENFLGMGTREIPEVAFIGRSNVGKSTLVNSIMRKELAHSSKTPGRTQKFQYYALSPKKAKSKSPFYASGFLIDLPGYGYAKAPDKVVSKWQKETQDFLIDRRDYGTLRQVFLLIDARRGVTTIDWEVMGWFDDAQIPYSIVLTKIDRVGKALSVRFADEICFRYPQGEQSPIVHLTSAAKKEGIYDLMATIDAQFASGFMADDNDE